MNPLPAEPPEGSASSLSRPTTSLPQLSPRGRVNVPLIPIDTLEEKKKKKKSKRKRRGSNSSGLSETEETNRDEQSSGASDQLLKSPEVTEILTIETTQQDAPLSLTRIRPDDQQDTLSIHPEINLLPPTPQHSKHDESHHKDIERSYSDDSLLSDEPDGDNEHLNLSSDSLEPEIEGVNSIENDTRQEAVASEEKGNSNDKEAGQTKEDDDEKIVETKEQKKEEEKPKEEEKKEPEKKEPEKKEPEKKPVPPAPPQEKAIVKALKKLNAAFIIDYEGRFRQTWDVIVFFICLYNWVTVPIRCGQSLVQIPPWVATDVLSDAVLWIDIVLNFRTTHSHMGVNVNDPKSIAKNYLKSYMIYDLLASLPVEYVGYGVSNWYPWFRLGRILRLTRYYYYFGNIENWSGISSAYIKLTSAVTMAFIATVMMSSAYLYVMLNEPNPSRLFMLGGVDVRPLTTWQQFIRGMCWAIQTWTQYQNTQPVWDWEQVVNLIVVAVGVFLYVVFVGTVKSLLSTLDVQKEEFQTKLDSVRAFMTYRQIPVNIKDKIVDYYSYVFESRNTLNESAVLADLPLYLRQEVVMYMNRDIIAKVPIFHGLEEQFIASIVLKLRPRVGLPNSFVLRKGDIGREMFIITKGAVEVVSEPDQNGNRSVFVVLQEGSFFGEIALLNDTTRNASIRCKDYCDLWVFTKNDFREAFEKFPEDVKNRILEEARKRNQPVKK
jgi:cyclic nucleotide gated channel alpha 3